MRKNSVDIFDDLASLTISEFGRRSGLSHKALRLYDMSGLLPPADIGSISGYRLYAPNQLERARRISLLRQLDMPLATVADVLAGTDEQAAARLDVWWEQQEAAARAKRGSLSYLRAQLARSGADAVGTYPVAVRRVDATKVATVTREVDQDRLVDAIVQGKRDIMQYLDDAGATSTGESWVLYHGFVTPDSEAPVEVCVPFEGTIDPDGDIAIRIEPSHAEAYCTVVRDDCCFPQILVAYDVVRDWVARSGYRSVGSPREIYFADWEAIEGTDPFVHVAQPLTPAPLAAAPRAAQPRKTSRLGGTA
jgi:DNA-binding transcriptional MerR regulator